MGRPKQPGERDKSGRLIPSEVGPPPERWQHQLGCSIEEFNETRGLNNVVKRKRVRVNAESALDALSHIGELGRDELRADRLSAGAWLRGLYVRTHPTRSAMRFDDGPRGNGDMSEAMAWNLKCYNDTLKALGPNASAVIKACCDNTMFCDLNSLRRGLDHLASLRGIRRLPDVISLDEKRKI